MQPASGTCPVCLAPLKWAEIGYRPHLDGARTEIRRLVCKNNHQTAQGPTALGSGHGVAELVSVPPRSGQSSC